MILPFSTQLNGKPTYFVEKILNSLIIEAEIKGFEDEYFGQLVSQYIEPFLKISNYLDYKELIEKASTLNPKIHTLRGDEKNRWTKGKNIDFFINCRQKNMFRFAPTIPVVSVQKVEITLMHWARFGIRYETKQGKVFTIKVDDNYLNDSMFEEFAQNDGFDTVEEFFQYFNEDFEGKIIHWTDKRY